MQFLFHLAGAGLLPGLYQHVVTGLQTVDWGIQWDRCTCGKKMQNSRTGAHTLAMQNILSFLCYIYESSLLKCPRDWLGSPKKEFKGGNPLLLWDSFG